MKKFHYFFLAGIGLFFEAKAMRGNDQHHQPTEENHTMQTMMRTNLVQNRMQEIWNLCEENRHPKLNETSSKLLENPGNSPLEMTVNKQAFLTILLSHQILQEKYDREKKPLDATEDKIAKKMLKNNSGIAYVLGNPICSALLKRSKDFLKDFQGRTELERQEKKKLIKNLELLEGYELQTLTKNLQKTDTKNDNETLLQICESFSFLIKKYVQLARNLPRQNFETAQTEPTFFDHMNEIASDAVELRVASENERAPIFARNSDNENLPENALETGQNVPQQTRSELNDPETPTTDGKLITENKEILEISFCNFYSYYFWQDKPSLISMTKFVITIVVGLLIAAGEVFLVAFFVK